MNQQLNLMWAAQQNRDMQSVFDLMQQSVNNGAWAGAILRAALSG
jgi:hypothetical protein